MATTNYQSKQEVIDAIKAMREYQRWSEKTSYTQTAEEAVDQAGGDAAGDGHQVSQHMRRAHWHTVSGKRLTEAQSRQKSASVSCAGCRPSPSTWTTLARCQRLSGE